VVASSGLVFDSVRLCCGAAIIVVSCSVSLVLVIVVLSLVFSLLRANYT